MDGRKQLRMLRRAACHHMSVNITGQKIIFTCSDMDQTNGDEICKCFRMLGFTLHDETGVSYEG
jgi:hypothetical protein